MATTRAGAPGWADSRHAQPIGGRCAVHRVGRWRREIGGCQDGFEWGHHKNSSKVCDANHAPRELNHCGGRPCAEPLVLIGRRDRMRWPDVLAAGSDKMLRQVTTPHCSARPGAAFGPAAPAAACGAASKRGDERGTVRLCSKFSAPKRQALSDVRWAAVGSSGHGVGFRPGDLRLVSSGKN